MLTVNLCQTPVLGLGVDFTFANNNNNNNNNNDPHLNFLRRDGTMGMKFSTKNLGPEKNFGRKKFLVQKKNLVWPEKRSNINAY